MKTDDAIHKDNASEASASMDNTSAAEFAAGRAGAPVAAAATATADAAAGMAQSSGSGPVLYDGHEMVMSRVINGRRHKFVIPAGLPEGTVYDPERMFFTKIEDYFARKLFGDPRAVSDLLNGFVYPALYREPVAVRAEDLKPVSTDSVSHYGAWWGVNARSGVLNIIDLEFHAQVDSNVPGLIRDDIEKITRQAEIISDATGRSGFPLPLPVLIYTGSEPWPGLYSAKWQAAMDPTRRGLLFISQPFVFLSPQHYELDELLAMDNNLAALIFALYRPLDPEQGLAVLKMASDLSPTMSDRAANDLTLFINYAFGRASPYMKYEVDELNPVPVETLQLGVEEFQMIVSEQLQHACGSSTL